MPDTGYDLSSDSLDALEALASKASPAPWVCDEDRIEVSGEDSRTSLVARVARHEGCDGKFIVATVNALPALVAEVRRLRGVMADILSLATHKPDCPLSAVRRMVEECSRPPSGER